MEYVSLSEPHDHANCPGSPTVPGNPACDRHRTIAPRGQQIVVSVGNPQAWARLDTPTITRRAEVPAGLTDPPLGAATDVIRGELEAMSSAVVSRDEAAARIAVALQRRSLLDNAGEVERLKGMLREACDVINTYAPGFAEGSHRFHGWREASK